MSKYTGWKAVRRLYSLYYFRKNIWRPIVLELICVPFIFLSDVSLFDQIKSLCGFVNGGYPSIVGFVLSGYALLIGFSNTDIIKAMSKKTSVDRPAMFQLINTTFAVILFILIITLITSLILNVVCIAEVPILLCPQLHPYVNGFVLLSFLFMVLYSMCSLLDVVINIFNFGQYAFVINTIKIAEEEDETKRENIYDRFLRWIKDIIVCIRKL